MKRKFIALIVFMAGIGLTACQSEQSETEQVVEPEVEKYTVQVEIECEENILFSRYGVKILIDDEELGTLEYGATDTYTAELVEGEHTLKAEKEDGVIRIYESSTPEEDSNGFLKRLPGIGLIEQLGEYTVGVKDNSKWGYIRIGRLSFYDVLFKTMSVTYSPETDQTDYPVMAKFTLDVETSQMVTERIINELYSVSSDGNDIFEDMDEAWEYYNT